MSTDNGSINLSMKISEYQRAVNRLSQMAKELKAGLVSPIGCSFFDSYAQKVVKISRTVVSLQVAHQNVMRDLMGMMPPEPGMRRGVELQTDFQSLKTALIEMLNKNEQDLTASTTEGGGDSP